MEMPYGMKELRSKRQLTEDTVNCHVRGCSTVKERARGHFYPREQYLCPKHQIYLTPSTFQYKDPCRNLLWRDAEDRALMGRIWKVKRTTARLGRERDEDALTWNVVRAFHREGRLAQLARIMLAGRQVEVPDREEPEIFYWSATSDGKRWKRLENAQKEFGEEPERGTEPDIALWWPEKCLIFVEAKFSSPNRIPPSRRPQGEDNRAENYGGHAHFADVFKAGYEEIATESKFYQLMRLWLLGTWLAKNEGVAFALVNLVRWGEETDIETAFGRRFCRQSRQRLFVRATWESIWDALPSSGLSEQTIAILDAYFHNKSRGYGADGRLQKAFTAQAERHGNPRRSGAGVTIPGEGNLDWFKKKDGWRRVWGPVRTMQQLVFRILRGCNDAHIDLHHQPATECNLDYNIARNIVEAFLASGWRPPGGGIPTLYDGN